MAVELYRCAGCAVVQSTSHLPPLGADAVCSGDGCAAPTCSSDCTAVLERNGGRCAGCVALDALFGRPVD